MTTLPLVPVLLLLTTAAQGAVCDGLRWWQADAASGWSATGRTLHGAVVAPEGRVGAALAGKPGDPPDLQALGHFDLAQGTWAAWVRREPGELPARGAWSWFSIEGGNFALTTHCDRHHPTFFMTGGIDNPAIGFRWDYAVMSQAPARWPGGVWHHVAIVWDRSGGRQLWLDGELAAKGPAAHLGGGVGPGQRLTLGGGAVATAFDEVMLWQRALAPAEIARLARDPVAVAAEAAQHAAAHPQAPAIWPVRIPVVGPATRPAGPGVVEPGASAEVPVTVHAERAWSGDLTLVWSDWRERELARASQRIELAAGGRITVPAAFTPPTRGLYKLTALVVQPGGTLSRDIATLACWPQPPGERPLGFFGHHVGSWNEQAAAWGKRFGVTQVRGHNMLQATWWPRVQPADGPFSWHLDHQVSYWDRPGGGAVLGQLFGTPWWADAKGARSPDKPNAYPSGARPRLDAFARYAEATVAHFQGRIRDWELWNEPDVSMFWGGSPEELAELATVGAAAIRRADPQARVLGMGFTPSSWAWHRAFAKAGGLAGLDVLTFHAYHRGAGDHELLWRELKSTVGHFRALAKEALGRELPLWDTESGCGDDSWFHGVEHEGLAPEAMRRAEAPRRSAALTVAQASFLMDLGVAKSFAYLWNSPGLDLQALDLGGVPRLRTLARQSLQELVDGQPHRGIVRREPGRLRASLWEVPGGTLVQWFAGQGAELAIPAQWPGPVLRRLDLLGAALPASAAWTVGDEPWYCEIAAPPAAVRAAIEAAAVVELSPAAPLPAEQDPSQAGHRVPDLPPFPAAVEGSTRLHPIDLGPAANFAFRDDSAGDGTGGSFDEGRFNCIDPMPLGDQLFHGVRFAIRDPATCQGRAAVVLPGRTIPDLAKVSPPIPVGLARVRCLWFLHASNWSGKAGNRIATYRVTYADGQQAEIPVVVDQGIRDWWQGFLADAACKPVPIRIAQDGNGKQAWRFLHVMEWANPRSDSAIASIALESQGTGAAVLVAGITACTW